MQKSAKISAVIINYRTGDLVKRAVESLRRYYAEIPLLLIDNGSGDGSENILKHFAGTSPAYTELIINASNLHHGPAMDQALHYLQSPFVLFIDSDCEIYEGGFIELMTQTLEQNERNYVAGKKVFMDKRGFDVASGERATEYIRPICMLLRRDIYLTLPKFIMHGAPCLDNMKTAAGRGFTLVNFQIEQYVKHTGRGTAGRYGYRLGWRGRFNYLLHKIGI